MSERIQVGDLVQVVRDCCGHWLGRVFVVGRIQVAEELMCEKCYWSAKKQPMCFVTPYYGKMVYMNLDWLKRIPPLSELEGQRTEENLKEPA